MSLSLRVTLACFALLALLCIVSPVQGSRGLPLELAEILPMSTEELLQLADQQADFITPTTTHETETEPVDEPALAEVDSESESEAQVESEVEAEAETQTTDDPAPATPAPAATAATPAPADAATPSAGEVPVIPIEAATVRLKKSREGIAEVESQIRAQTAQYKMQLAREPPPPSRGDMSSGTNYWEEGVRRLKSSAGTVVGNSASALTQADAQCVVCQYVVQQAMGLLAGHPLATGGATAGGKRAAALAVSSAAAAPADAPAAATFLELSAELELDDAADEDAMFEEMETEEDPFAFLEMDASVDIMAGMGVDAVLAAEMESTVALNAAVENFLSAADAAMEHSAVEAERSHYDFGGRALRHYVQRPYTGPNLRNVAPTTYPDQLNDYGYDNPRRNRQADILQFRPRQARFTRGEKKEAEAKWDATREKYQKLYTGVYKAFEKLCSKRMPLAYSGYCTEMMKDYRYIAQGIIYGDRAQSICMNGNWCNRQSYIRHAVHAYFTREAGDK